MTEDKSMSIDKNYIRPQAEEKIRASLLPKGYKTLASTRIGALNKQRIDITYISRREVNGRVLCPPL